MSDNDRSAFRQDDPQRGPLDRAANALDGRDDPNRGPLDRAENVFEGRDDPDRGPLDRAANAVTGGTGGISGAMAHDDPNRRPFDRAANAVTDGAGGVSGMDDRSESRTGGRVVSAIFDNEREAQAAVSDLRSTGVSEGAVSLLTQNRNTVTTRDAGGDVVDEEHGSLLRGILGGGALGAGLGVAALAIPGVGPLVGLGAIAASAVPGAMATGAAVGAVAGTFNELLVKHGINDDDASYYGEHMKSGGILVTVDPSGVDSGTVRDILHRNGGHNASRARTAAM